MYGTKDYKEAVERWRNLSPQYVNGKLEIDGHPVMQDWEIPYMKKLADIACSEGGNVQEIGGGMGISARFIQDNLKAQREAHPDETPGVHVIAELNRGVADFLRQKFAPEIEAGTLKILEGDFMETLPVLSALRDGGDITTLDKYENWRATHKPQEGKAHFVLASNRAEADSLREKYQAEVNSHTLCVLEGDWQGMKTIMEQGFGGSLPDTYALVAAHANNANGGAFPYIYHQLKPGGILSHYADEERTYSAGHREALLNAGFKAEDIGGEAVDMVDRTGKAQSSYQENGYWGVSDQVMLASRVQKPVDAPVKERFSLPKVIGVIAKSCVWREM